MAGFPPDYNTSGFRYFSKPFNTSNGVQGFTLLQDPNLVWWNGSTLTTGGWRPAKPADFAANISVSGLNLTVGAVAVTGTAAVLVTNTAPMAVSGVATILSLPSHPVQITGSPSVTVANGAVPISGNVNVVGGGSLNVAVTGGVISASSSATSITGNPGVTVVNPIAVTGLTVNSTVNTVSVTGSPTFIVGNPIAVTGLTVSTTSGPQAITGSVGVTAFNGILPISGNVAINTPIAVTGLTVNSTVNTVSITGMPQVFDPTVAALLTGVSGLLSTNLFGAAWVTGQINVTNPIAVTGLTVNAQITSVAVTGGVTINNPIAVTGLAINSSSGPQAITGSVAVTPANGVFAISGVVTAGVSNPIGVTGTITDTALPSINGLTTKFVAIGGKVVAPSGAGSITGYNSTGDMAMLNICQTNGGVLVNQGILDQTQDNVTVWAASSGSASNDGVTGTFGNVLASNPSRRAWFIQNLATGALMVRFSASNPTTSNLSFILKGGSAANDGSGGSWNDSPAVYTGPVSVSGLGGATVSCAVWQI
jgi:hypothetical protein